MKVLLTGHAGFVGQEFLRWFERDSRQWDITLIDVAREQPEPWRAVPQDARDFFRTDATKYDLVIHLAAVVGGRATIEGNPLKVATDLSIDAEMFNWAMRTRPYRIVYYSSSAAYPIDLQDGSLMNKDRQLYEDDINLEKLALPDMTYGWAKLTGELLAAHARDVGLRVQVFRPFSGYGERQSLDYPFPSFITRAVRGDDPFTVWGDGTAVRDFIHIEDVVAATMRAAELEVPGPINLSTGRATSFNELAELVMKAAAYSAPVYHIETQPVGVQYRVGNPDELRKFYVPKIELEQGIWRAMLFHGYKKRWISGV